MVNIEVHSVLLIKPRDGLSSFPSPYPCPM